MEKLPIPKSLKPSMIYHSSFCDKHPFRRKGEDIPNPIQRMVINGQVVCPRCEAEKGTQELQAQMQEQYELAKQNEAYNTLFTKSILDDNTLLQARFSNYRVMEPEETANKDKALDCFQRYRAGEVFNLILQGKQGTGKSHLAYALLWELNMDKQHSCLFVSIDSMLRKIKASFRDKESKYTEEYFNGLLSEVDYLVLDDLGAETGAIDTEKAATDFVQRVLYGIANVRQDKATIITTNLDSKTLFSMYDKKLVSRLLRSPEFVIFKDTKDKRVNKLPF